MSQFFRRFDFSLDVHALKRPGPQAPSAAADRAFVLGCPDCGRRLRAATARIGRIGRCPACRHTFPIPSPDAGT